MRGFRVSAGLRKQFFLSIFSVASPKVRERVGKFDENRRAVEMLHLVSVKSEGMCRGGGGGTPLSTAISSPDGP